MLLISTRRIQVKFGHLPLALGYVGYLSRFTKIDKSKGILFRDTFSQGQCAGRDAGRKIGHAACLDEK